MTDANGFASASDAERWRCLNFIWLWRDGDMILIGVDRVLDDGCGDTGEQKEVQYRWVGG